MAKAKVKTTETDASVGQFLASVTPEAKRQDAEALCALMQKATGKPPKMWGKHIVGFGKYTFVSPRSGREVDWMATGFSPRKQNLTVYIIPGFKPYQAELKQLGKHKTTLSCLHFNKLADIDQTILARMVKDSVKRVAKQYKPA